jgi:hypothetical protein
MKCINKKLVKVKSALDNVLEERNVLTMMKSVHTAALPCSTLCVAPAQRCAHFSPFAHIRCVVLCRTL